MKNKRKFFNFFSKSANKPNKSLPNPISLTENPQNPSHFMIKLQENSPFKPDGDIIITDPCNDLSLNPDSFHRLKGFSVISDEIGSEKKYEEINQSLNNTRREDLFVKITKEMANASSFGLNDSDKTKNSKTKTDSNDLPLGNSQKINLKIIEKTNDDKTNDDKTNDDKNNDKTIKKTNEKNIKKTNEKNIEKTNEKTIEKTNEKIIEKIIEKTNEKTNEEFKNNGKTANKLEFIKENFIKLRFFTKSFLSNFDFHSNKFFDILKHLFLCYFLVLNVSIYQEIYVGLYTGILLSFLLSKIVLQIYEEVIQEIQYTSLLKELQVFRIDDDRKAFIRENLKNDNEEDLNYWRKICLFGSPFMSLSVFPLLLTSLYSFAIILQCVLIWLYFIIVSLVFCYNNNRKVERIRIRERGISMDFHMTVQSRMALKDLSSSYLRFLQDFERTKTKLMKKSNQNNDNSLKYSSYLKKKTLEIGLKRIKFFEIPYRSIVESFFCFFSVLLLLYLNYLLIFAFLNKDLSAVLAICIGSLFIVYRYIMRFIFQNYFLYQKLDKILKVLLCFAFLLPYKLMIFIVNNSLNSDVNSVFKGMVTIFMIKTGFKIAFYSVLGQIWFKYCIKIHQSDQKNHRKKFKKNSESIANSHLFKENKESLKEYIDKQCKEFSVDFFLFNFSDFIITFLILISSLTLYFIPKTRWNYLKREIFEGYLQYVGIDLGVDGIVIFLLYLILKKYSPVFERKEWIMDGVKFLNKRREIYILGLYFMFYINFYCFEVFFLLPYKN